VQLYDQKLKSLPEKKMMSLVLENFTILEVIMNRNEILLCVAYMFEVFVDDSAVSFRIVKDNDQQLMKQQ